MTSQISACIIAQPGKLRDALYILLRAIPRIEIVCQMDNVQAALTLGKTVCPTIALLDCDGACSGIVSTLEQLRPVWAETRYIALVDHEQERPAAVAAGADMVLVKGMLATQLFTTIENLVRQHEIIEQ